MPARRTLGEGGRTEAGWPDGRMAGWAAAGCVEEASGGTCCPQRVVERTGSANLERPREKGPRAFGRL